MNKIIYLFIITALSYNMAAQGEISGKITNKASGEAIPGVTVYIPEIQKGTVTDENGIYLLKNLPTGTFKLRFSFIGYATVIKAVDLSDKKIKLDIQLSESDILSEEVVVSGGSYSAQHENAIKIESLSAKELETANSASFIESIAQSPGVDMISKGTGIATPVIRGLSLSNILLLNNGIRMENFQFSEDHPFMINEAGVDRVEIIKGPASLLYGSDAIGGVINIIDEKAATNNKIQADFGTSYNGNTKGVNADLGIKGTKKDFFWIVRGGTKTHADYIDGSGQHVPNSRYNTASVKVNMGINKNYGKFSLRYNFDKMKLGLTVPPAINLVQDNTRKNDFWYQDLSNQLIASRNVIFINQTKTEINIAFQQNLRKLQGSDLTNAFTLVDMRLGTISYELKTYLPLRENNQLIIGFQGMNQQNKNFEAPEHVLPDYSMNDISGFGILQLKPTEKFNAQIGLRYDMRFLDIPWQTNGEDKDVDGLNTDFSNLNGSVGMTYHLLKTLLLRANFASAYRAPNIAELSQDGVHDNRYEQGDKNLVPQKSYEADLSMHYHLKKLTFDLAGYYNRINNYLYLSPTSDTSETGMEIFRHVQQNAKIYGMETGIAYRPVKWFSTKASYAYVLAEQEDGENLPFIPQNKIREDIAFSKDKIGFLDNISLGASAVYAFEQNKPAMFETNTDAYFLLNSSISFDMKINKQQLNVKFFANNLLDETYIDHLSTLKELNYYNIGRNMGISVRFLF